MIIEVESRTRSSWWGIAATGFGKGKIMEIDDIKGFVDKGREAQENLDKLIKNTGTYTEDKTEFKADCKSCLTRII